MPWKAVKGHGCSGETPWAVIKSDTGEKVSCHETEEKANDAVKALYAQEDQADTEALAYEPDGDGNCPPGHHKMPNGKCLPDGHSESDVRTLATDKPWDGSASRFTDEQYQRSCAACDPASKGTPKERCFLPHHEPDGTLNSNGVHNSASRVSQLKDRSPDAVSRAKSHLRSHYRELDEEPPDSLAASADLSVEEMQQFHVAPEPGQWEGVLAIEGSPTGDGREFAPGSLTWADLPVPLKWMPQEEMGHEGSVIVGRIDKIQRKGSEILGEGVFDLGGENGREAYRLTRDGFLKGVSIDVDAVTAQDIEYVFPEDSEGDSAEDGLDGLLMLFGPPPEKMIFHDGRVRAATLTPMPAFVEASIELLNPDEEMPPLVALPEGVLTWEYNVGAAKRLGLSVVAVGPHSTATSDKTWDPVTSEGNLPSPMSVAQARSAYAYVDDSKVEGGRVAKGGGRFLHHEVDSQGDVGAANLTACHDGLEVLRKGRGGSALSKTDRRAIYDHLAAHERSAGREVEFYALLAHGLGETDDLPPAEWFQDPGLSVPTAITVSDDGRVYGHAAQWGACHVGYGSECVQPPREEAHPYFMTGEVVCADGSCVAVGQITLGTGHASLGLGPAATKAHYDDTGCAVADVAVGNDKHGIWVAGAIRPGTDPVKVRELRASGQVSGDWRRIGGRLRLMGLLAVNVPGFPVQRPKAQVASGQPMALVAAGRITVGRGAIPVEAMVQQALRVMRDKLVARVHGGGEK